MAHFVASLGFSTETVVRPIFRHGVGDGDSIILVGPDQDDDDAHDTAIETVNDIRSMFSTVGAQTTVEHRTVTVDPFIAPVECSEIIAEVTDQGSETVIVTGGGGNEVILALYTAAVAHVDTIDSVEVHTQTRNRSFSFTPPRLHAKVPGRARRTFEAIGSTDEALSVSGLANQTDQSASSVSRHLDDLEAEGLVTTRREDGQRLASLSMTAELLLKTGVAMGAGSG